MNPVTINDRVKNVMSLVFGLPVEQVDEDLKPEDVENWDSVNHLNLVTALEEEFGVEFDEQQIPLLTSLQVIVGEIRSLGGHD
jgi:acyl carrier protein